MRTTAQQKELNEMSEEEKLKRTSMEEYEKRGTLIGEYNYRYVVVNEYPHFDRGDEQLIIWETDNTQSKEKTEELIQIRKEKESLNFLNHGTDNKSVKGREHWHLFSEKE